MELAELDGVTLAYETTGAGEAVVCIHGAFVADTFRHLATVPSLARRYRVVQYHRRGYAASSHTPEPATIGQEARDCSALLAHLGVERAHVVGHSYGGAVALQLAIDNPEVVHTLALLEPAVAVGESAQEYRESMARGAQHYRQVGPAASIDGALRVRWPRYREALDRLVPGAFDQAVADADTAFTATAGLLDWQFGEAEARRITQPVLMVRGGDSEALGPRFGETHRSLLTWLPDAEGYVLPGVTHFLHLEEPGLMAEALSEFYARHPLAGPRPSGNQGVGPASRRGMRA